MSAGSQRSATVLMLLLVQVLFGLHYLAAKLVVAEVPPRLWAGVRVAAATACLLPLAFMLRGPRAVPAAGDLVKLAGLSLFGVILNQWAFVEGLSRTSVTHSALINTAIPVLTLLLAVALRQERLSRRKTASVLLATAGVLVLLEVEAFSLDTTTAGDLITLLNATSFSLFLVLSRPVLSRLDPLMATGFLFLFGSLGLLPLSVDLWAETSWPLVSGPTLLWALYIVLGATVLAYTLNYIALRRVESSMVALFILLQPLLAAVTDIVVMRSEPGPRLGVASVLILTGVGVAVVTGRRPATA